MKAFLFALHLYCLPQIHAPLLFSFSSLLARCPGLKKKKSFLTFSFNRGLYGTFLATAVLMEVVRWDPRRKPLKWAASTKQRKHTTLEAGREARCQHSCFLLDKPLSLTRCVLTWSCLYAHAVLMCLPLLIRTPNILDQVPTKQPHLNLITTLKILSPNMVTLWGTKG